MINQFAKVIFWSALAVFFCFLICENYAKASFSDIQISEIYYDTSGIDTGQEWIEIYNRSDGPVDLTGYDLYYGSYFTFPDFVLEKESYVLLHNNLDGTDSTSDLFTGTTGSSNMGNTSGSVALFNSPTHSSATIVDFVQYGDAGKTWQSSAVSAGIWSDGEFVPDVTEGNSIELKELDLDNNLAENWQEQVAPTPKGEILPPKEDSAEYQGQEVVSTITDARGMEAGQEVVVYGVVSIPPNKLSSQYFYIQDETAGIQIYCNKKDFPDLVSGDYIKVTGEIGGYYNDKRIKIYSAGDIIIVGKKEIPGSKTVKIEEINDDLVGQIVSFEGTVSSTSGSTFYLEDGNEVKINIKDETNIQKPRMSQGDRVKIVGVVSKYKDTYQVLPFEQSGVIILSSGRLPKGGKSAKNQKYNLIYYLGLWNLLPKAKLKRKKLRLIWPKR